MEIGVGAVDVLCRLMSRTHRERVQGECDPKVCRSIAYSICRVGTPRRRDLDDAEACHPRRTIEGLSLNSNPKYSA